MRILFFVFDTQFTKGKIVFVTDIIVISNIFENKNVTQESQIKFDQ